MLSRRSGRKFINIDFLDYVMGSKIGITKKEIAAGVVHKVPADLRKALTSTSKVREAWNNLTPLGRNEWICWIISAKRVETREHHIERVCTEILEGKRRPCCWAGCNHR